MPLGRCPSDLVGNVTTTAGEFTASMRSQPAPGCCRSRHGTVFISRVRSAGSVTRWSIRSATSTWWAVPSAVSACPMKPASRVSMSEAR